MSIFSRGASSDADLQMAKDEFEALANAASERTARMAQYREEGNVVRSPELRPFGADEDYGRRRRVNDGQRHRHQIAMPLGKALTVKHSYRIAGQLPDIIVDQRDESPQERHRSDSMEKIAWTVQRHSNAETTMAAGSWNASELGSAVFDLYYKIDKQIACYRSCDPVGIFEVQGVDDPHDFERIYRVWDAPLASVQMTYRNATFRGQPVPVGDLGAFHNVDGVDMVRIVQLCDRDLKLRFALSHKGGLIGLHEHQHDYGFVPYVIIPNLGPYEDVWGFADYEFVRALAGYIGKEFSREADVIKAVAGGAYIDKGTGQSSATIAKVLAEGGIVAARRDSELEPIDSPDMPAFVENHAERAMDLLKMLGFAPDAAWGLPGSGSGTDRGLQLQPLLEYTAMKQLNWQAGLSRLFSYAYRMIEQKMTTSATYAGARPSGKLGKPKAFAMMFGPSVEPLTAAVDGSGGLLDSPAEMVELPRTPRELFDGEYTARFVWRNRVDPEDPQYVLSEVNKFTQGLQSMETTLENLGVQAPEDEMRRIEKEAKRFPWVNQGLVSLIMAQLKGNSQGEGGGAPADPGAAMMGALGTITGGGGGRSGALNADAAAGALGSDAVGVPYGAA